MFELQPNAAADKAALYAELGKQLIALLAGEQDFIAAAANAAALLYHTLPDVNWVGFYRLVGDELVLGAFQGKPACMRIPPGKGVCGIAAARRKTVLVPNVHEFPGHIVCDSTSNSEIVVPLVKNGVLLGVLDLDSPKPGRFDAVDRRGLERAVGVFAANTSTDTLH